MRTLSTMESNDLGGQLLEIERAEAAPYVRMLPSPWWYPPLAGVWAAGLAAVLLWDLPRPTLLALVVLELALVAWMVRRQGVWPRLSGPKPREIDRAYRRFLLGLGVLLAAVALTAWLGGPTPTVVVVLVGVTVALGAYERHYEHAAARVRERLGMA